jgi:hypothetical protein
MRISGRQLRRLIREAAPAQTIELTAEPNQADMSSAWPDRVMYKGQKVFDIFYSDAAMSAQWAFVEDQGYDDGQEAYLGYDISSDIFVMGFDAFPADHDLIAGRNEDGGGEMEGLVIELRGDGTPRDVVGSYPGGMYPEGLRGLKREFPGIIDVRLD